MQIHTSSVLFIHVRRYSFSYSHPYSSIVIYRHAYYLHILVASSWFGVSKCLVFGSSQSLQLLTQMADGRIAATEFRCVSRFTYCVTLQVRTQPLQGTKENQALKMSGCEDNTGFKALNTVWHQHHSDPHCCSKQRRLRVVFWVSLFAWKADYMTSSAWKWKLGCPSWRCWIHSTWLWCVMMCCDW